MKTYTAKNETVQRDWYVVDAEGKTLGRLSAELAHRLRGKHKPIYTPHVDAGDYMIVINAEKIAVTGNKLADKKYHRFTGYIGNLKTETLEQALELMSLPRLVRFEYGYQPEPGSPEARLADYLVARDWLAEAL